VEGWGLLAVERRRDGVFLGMCGLHHQESFPDEVEDNGVTFQAVVYAITADQWRARSGGGGTSWPGSRRGWRPLPS
jgi:hypothetical protein